MKLATTYDTTEVLRKIEKETGENTDYKNYFLCVDVLDVHLIRVIEGMNSDYNYEDGKCLIEEERVSVYDIADLIMEKSEAYNGLDRIHVDRTNVHTILESISNIELATLIIKEDFNRGFENWDFKECNDIYKAIDMIDGGFGIYDISDNRIEVGSYY